jgi:hypothetical protein
MRRRPGATVTFADPIGASHHNADFGGGPQATSCTHFAVALNAAARRALRRRGRLAFTAAVAITRGVGARTSVSRRVQMES